MDTENENKFCAVTGAKTPSVSVNVGGFCLRMPLCVNDAMLCWIYVCTHIRQIPLCVNGAMLCWIYIAEYICTHVLAMQMDDTPMWSLKKLKAYIIYVKSRYVFAGHVIAFKQGRLQLTNAKQFA